MKSCRIAVSVLVFLFSAFCFPAESVMPPDVYARMSEQSKIKATAVVEEVKTLEITRQSTWKSVVFSLKHPMSKGVPEKFSGTCYSVDHEWQQPPAGGTIYFYPEKGDLVYVTVAADGGSITSYTYLNDVMESLFIDNAEKIRYGMGNAWLDL
ncbi:MAG: hypothetical protein WCZ25_12175 [Aminobacteriaceae bacterium]